MLEELESLVGHNTYTLEELPHGYKAIPTKWVFTKKRSADGSVVRYKARLVAQGFRQLEGLDYEETFAPTSKYTSLRAVIAVAAANNLELHHLDYMTAFLNGTLEETIYVAPAPGFSDGNPSLAYRLHKALYGLKQASRAWYTTLNAALLELGYTPSVADPGLYTSADGLVVLLVYVDDVLVAAPTSADMERAKLELIGAFPARDLGPASLFLGMAISRDRTAKTIKLSQPRHAADLLSKFNMTDANPCDTPSSAATKLTAAGTPLDTKACPYAALIGSLNYVACCTRPDISQAVGALASYMANPTTDHWTAGKRLLRYLAGTADYGITYGLSDYTLEAYCDADYAGDPDTRRSTTGYAFILNGGAISWSSRKQSTVAASTTEAEYMAAAAAVKEALWMRNLLESLHFPLAGPISINADNQSAIHLLKNPVLSQRSKHIDVHYHLARERVARGEVSFSYVPTTGMAADFLTKSVPPTKHKFCCQALGIS